MVLEKIKTPDGEGKVVMLDVLNKKYSVDINGDVIQYEAGCPKGDK